MSHRWIRPIDNPVNPKINPKKSTSIDTALRMTQVVQIAIASLFSTESYAISRKDGVKIARRMHQEMIKIRSGAGIRWHKCLYPAIPTVA